MSDETPPAKAMCRDCGEVKELLDARCFDCWTKTGMRAGGEVLREAMEEHPFTKSILQIGKDWAEGRKARLGKKDEKP